MKQILAPGHARTSYDGKVVLDDVTLGSCPVPRSVWSARTAWGSRRCPPPDADVSVLSGGERRRVALCALLLSQPDLLLLDEPTNHLDAESVAWLEQHLEKYAGTVVAVTHDRYFLDNVAGWVLELDRGHAYPYEGNYSTYLATKAARIKVEGAKDAKRTLAEDGDPLDVMVALGGAGKWPSRV